MAYCNNENQSPGNPNAMPLGKRPYPPSPLPFPPPMPRNDIRSSPRGRSRSPLRPVKAFEFDENGGLVPKEGPKIEDCATDSEVLHNLLEKMTLRLDTANTEVASQKVQVTLLEKMLKEKQGLIEQYQKRVRNNIAESKDLHKKREEAVEQCEKFKWEVVKLSHELHYMQTTEADSKDTSKLKMRCIKLRRERDLARDKCRELLVEKGGCLNGWSSAEERVIKDEYGV